MAKTPKIFVSYSHKDKKWLEELQPHFKALEEDSAVDLWDDTEIKYGDDWNTEISDALTHAKAAILLVSADFLASDYIVNHELKNILEKGEKEGLLNLMLIVRPCSLGKLERFQAINSPDKPLAGMDKVEREKIFVKLIETIRKALLIKPETERPELGWKTDLEKTGIPHLTLKIIHKEDSEKTSSEYKFHQDLITIGRDPSCNLSLSDQSKRVSKHHAEITYSGDKIFITDLDSMNFTYLNQKRLMPQQPCEILPNSNIWVGPFEISVEDSSMESPEDLTVINTVNPYKNDVEQLAIALRQIGQQYDRESSRRYRVMLQNALKASITDTEHPEAYSLIAHWLLKNVEGSSL